jgi:hypothetical protein
MILNHYARVNLKINSGSLAYTSWHTQQTKRTQPAGGAM